MYSDVIIVYACVILFFLVCFHSMELLLINALTAQISASLKPESKPNPQLKLQQQQNSGGSIKVMSNYHYCTKPEIGSILSLHFPPLDESQACPIAPYS